MTLPIHEPLLIFSIVMLNVLIAPILAEKLKLPGILGLIISGIIFGPHLFGIIERDQTIQLFETIGILYIMFQAGLEINLLEVKKNKSHSLIFGLLTFFIPLILGILSGFYLLKLNILQSILLASMFSSHTLLTFPLVTKLGLTKRPEVSTTIGGTIITDTFALLILAVVVKVYKGSIDIFFWLNLLISITIYVFSVIFLFPKLTRWFFKTYSSDTGLEEYVFLFTFLFFISYLSHMAGLEPIIGAFLVGLSINKLIPKKSILMDRIHFVGSAIFIPFFLISVGMIIDPRAFISNFLTIKVSIVMTVITILSKYLAAFILSKIIKYTDVQRNLVFGLSVNQAAATLAAVLIGFEIGIFDENILSGTILMIVFTTFVGSIVTNKAVQNLLAKDKELSSNKKQNNLSGKILLPIKNISKINGLTEFAFCIASQDENEAIYPLNVVYDGEVTDASLEFSEELLTKILIKGTNANKSIIPLTKIDSNLSSAIKKSCQEYRINKVILGWSKKPIFTNFIYKNNINHYISNSNEMVFLSKILGNLSLTNNLLILLPPFITMQKGFNFVLDELFSLSKFLNSSLTFVADLEIVEDLKKNFNNIKNIDIKFVLLESFKGIEVKILKLLKDDDLLIQVCGRQGDISWRLDFEKISENFFENKKINNFVSIFPYNSVEDINETREFLSNDEFVKNINPQNFILNKDIYSISALLEYYVEEKKPNFYKTLLNLCKEEAIELSHQTLLFHSHTEEISEPEIIIFSNKKGITDNDNKICKIIIIFLSPKNLSLKIHLKILSEIAKFVKNQNEVNSLINAVSYNDFITFRRKK